MTEPQSGVFESFDGTRIAYRKWGEPTKLGPLIFCSGIACDEVYWSYLAPALGSERQVVTWDYPYHGGSGPAGDLGELSIASMSRHAHQLALHLDIETAIFAGHSMGVQIVLEHYRLHPETVAGMILIAGPYQNTVGHLYGTGVGQHILSLLELGSRLQPGLAQTLWALAVNPTVADPIGRAGGLIGRAPARLMQHYFHHLASIELAPLLQMFRQGQEHSADDLLDSVDVPVLLLHGDSDVMTPLSLAEEMARRMPQAELVAIEGGAHTLPIEDPPLIEREIRRFLAHKIDSKQ